MHDDVVARRFYHTQPRPAKPTRTSLRSRMPAKGSKLQAEAGSQTSPQGPMGLRPSGSYCCVPLALIFLTALPSPGASQAGQRRRRKRRGWRRGWQRAPVSLLENPMDRAAWGATVPGAAESRTRLKGLSTHHHLSVPPFLPLSRFLVAHG